MCRPAKRPRATRSTGQAASGRPARRRRPRDSAAGRRGPGTVRRSRRSVVRRAGTPAWSAGVFRSTGGFSASPGSTGSAADLEASQVTAGAGVTLSRLPRPPRAGPRRPDRQPGQRDRRRAVAANAGGLRVLRYGPMRAQLRGIEAVLSDGTVLSHLSGLVKDNTGYDYPSLLAGSEGTLAVVTQARLRLVPRPAGHRHRAVRVPQPGRAARIGAGGRRRDPGPAVGRVLHGRRARPAGNPGRPGPAADRPRRGLSPAEADGPGALDDLAAVAGDRPAAVAQTPADRARLWAYRERHPDAAGFLGCPSSWTCRCLPGTGPSWRPGWRASWPAPTRAPR